MPNRRTRRLAIAATLTALIVPLVTGQAATAAPRPENDLRGFCSHRLTTECVAVANNDDGWLTIRDRRGHDHPLTTQRAAIRYLRHHAPLCTEEDSPRCYWNAGHRGNGYGDSFIVIGGKREGQGTVWYLGNL